MTTQMLKLVRAGLAATMLTLSAVAGAQEATPEATNAPFLFGEATPAAGMLPDEVIVSQEGLFPEGVEYDSLNARFLVSSTSEGTVYAVADDGTLTPFIEDDRIPGSFGLEVDEANNRLLVVASDQESLAFLGIYDLTSGASIAWVDFAPLLPNDPEHFVNDVAVDAQGNAYVTDSFAGVIYRVDPAGAASVFLEDESFSNQFALNGIVYHEAANALIAVRKPGLIVIPLDNPTAFTEVVIATPLPGADGLVLLNETTLVAVNNNPPSVYRFESNDQFATAAITGEFLPGNVFPTTVAEREGEAYVLYAFLNAEEAPVTDYPIRRVDFADPVEATPDVMSEAVDAPIMDATAEATDES